MNKSKEEETSGVELTTERIVKIVKVLRANSEKNKDIPLGQPPIWFAYCKKCDTVHSSIEIKGECLESLQNNQNEV